MHLGMYCMLYGVLELAHSLKKTPRPAYWHPSFTCAYRNVEGWLACMRHQKCNKPWKVALTHSLRAFSQLRQECQPSKDMHAALTLGAMCSAITVW